jgi:hypothetical protein
MAQDTHIYDEVNGKADLKKIFMELRQDVEQAKTRPTLTELYKRAGYLITLTYAPSWEAKFGKQAIELRKAAMDEFSTTVHKINRRAREIGAEAGYDETWGAKK